MHQRVRPLDIMLWLIGEIPEINFNSHDLIQRQKPLMTQSEVWSKLGRNEFQKSNIKPYECRSIMLRHLTEVSTSSS